MRYDITSPANQRIKWLLGLRQRRNRDAEGVFVVEGVRLYERALASGLTPKMTFVDSNGTPTTGPTFTVSSPVMDKASYRSRSQGLIAVFRQLDTKLRAVEVGASPMVLVTEGIEKPGNLGAMLRTAEATGVDAVIAVGTAVDPHNPNVLRASTGALFGVPLAVSDWAETEEWLTGNRIAGVCVTPDATTSMWDSDLSGALALIVGAEDVGLTERARSVAQREIAIPQVGDAVDSLNVSVAAAVVLFEAVRQRSHAGG